MHCLVYMSYIALIFIVSILQFKALLTTVEAFDKHSVNRKYLKYKPSVSLNEGRREWWNYAIRSVLEEDVKRRLQMWSWKHIKQHRLVHALGSYRIAGKFGGELNLAV